jgi:putative tryptophan/tyrosine transport system substrate-binding protein
VNSIAGLAGVAAWPVASGAQQADVPVIGWLSAGRPSYIAEYLCSGAASPSAAMSRAAILSLNIALPRENTSGCRRWLKETGYIEGRNVAVDYRWAEGQYDRVPAMAAELVRRQVAVIVANTPGVLAVKAATTTVHIVFATSSDPVQIGLVASLSRPGGNVTGVTQLNVEVGSRRGDQLVHLLRPLMT